MPAPRLAPLAALGLAAALLAALAPAPAAAARAPAAAAGRRLLQFGFGSNYGSSWTNTGYRPSQTAFVPAGYDRINPNGPSPSSSRPSSSPSRSTSAPPATSAPRSTSGGSTAFNMNEFKGTSAYATLARNRDAKCDGSRIECFRTACARAMGACAAARGKELRLVRCPASVASTFSECYATQDVSFACFGRPRPTTSANLDAFCPSATGGASGSGAPAPRVTAPAPAPKPAPAPEPEPEPEAEAEAPPPPPEDLSPVGAKGAGELVLVDADEVAPPPPPPRQQRQAPAPAPEPEPEPERVQLAPPARPARPPPARGGGSDAASAALMAGALGLLFMGH
ncbi:MAG: hypothetical protein J3K34DRAFT_460911 [Monoraphidium minutum]|nr:MAG: hypothetical protein J3K34DRAFT_460911 [Monoraphidium minutum]